MSKSPGPNQIEIRPTPALKRAGMIAFLGLVLAPFILFAAENPFARANDVTWDSLGKDENESMPLGNGDVGLNVWTEQNGDVVLLIAKADAWSENGQLLKLGRVRIKFTPNPFVSEGVFKQTQMDWA